MRTVLNRCETTARVAPTRASSPGCSGVGATLVVAHACRRPRYRARRARRRPCRFPDGLVWVGTDATRAWHATSYEGNEAVLDSGWATARVAPTRASSPGCLGRGDACRRPRLSSPTLSRPQGAPSPTPVSRWPRLGRYGRHKGVARHLVRRKRSRAGFGMGDRKGRPYAGLVAGLFGAVGATLSRPQGAPSPMPVSRWPRLGRYGSRKGVARHLVRRKRSRAGFGMGDRKGRPYDGYRAASRLVGLRWNLASFSLESRFRRLCVCDHWAFSRCQRAL